MKNILLLLTFPLGAFLSSCQKDPEIPVLNLSIKDHVEIYSSAVKFSGNVTSNITMENVGIQLCQNDSFIHYDEYETKLIQDSFSIFVTDLKPLTTYYYRYHIYNKLSSYIDKQRHSLKTKDYTTPDVITTTISDVAYTSARCGGNILDDGGIAVIESGICFSYMKAPTIEDFNVSANVKLGEFSCKLIGLEDGKTYHVRAYAKNNKGITYGEERKFTTKAYSTPLVETNPISTITMNSAIGGGNITEDGGYSILERGICYSTMSMPSIYDKKVINQTPSLGKYSCEIKNLSESTKYYVRAYAINEKGISYGQQVSFVTQSRPIYSFSVSSSTKILFSPGNLQYNASIDQWRFAEHQYSIIGISNNNIGPYYNGWIDLFGYRTSGYNGIYPYETSKDYSDYSGNKDDINGTNYDWGVYNAIVNGGNNPGIWRTITYDEIQYLLKYRVDATKKCFSASIGSTEGIILLPDEWIAPSGFSKKTSYTISEWNDAESCGAVFLPCAGYRTDKNGVCNEYSPALSGYWTATIWPVGSFGSLLFVPSLNFNGMDPYLGFSVRLVKNID